jgi:hypothetical protein
VLGRQIRDNIDRKYQLEEKQEGHPEGISACSRYSALYVDVHVMVVYQHRSIHLDAS